MQVVLKGINFTQGQKNIIEAANDRDIKYILATYSRQCGKSTVVLYLCIRWLTGVNNEIIYFTPTFKLARRFYKKLINLFPKELIRS